MAALRDEESLVRPEIWAVARRYYDADDWDKAIFDALKKVESITQHHVGNSKIGQQLFDEAFTQAPPKVVISQDSKDLESLFRLFAGAVGIYKGDRSHGDEPAIKFGTREECLRILVLASGLLDILDRNEAQLPVIVSARQETAQTLELHVERLTPQTKFFVDGNEATVQFVLQPGYALIELAAGTAGQVQIIAENEGKSGRPFVFEVLEQLPTGQNWHRVERIGAEIYTSQAMKERLPVRVVFIRSCEGGHQYVRPFPTRQNYSVGDYLTWTWEKVGAVGEAWYSRDGKPELAWSASTYFAGVVCGHSGSPRLASITLHPTRPTLRLGDRVPLRVIGHYSDGFGDWDQDLTNKAAISSNDQSIARLALGNVGPAVTGKGLGDTIISATIESRHARSAVSVKSAARGDTSEFLGGYKRIIQIIASKDGLVFANQGDSVYRLKKDLSLEVLTKFDLPPSQSAGLDYLAIDGNGDLYVRALWDNSIRSLTAASNFKTGDRVTLPQGYVAMGVFWYASTGLLITDNVGGIWSWNPSSAVPQVWANLPGFCRGFVETPTGVTALLSTEIIVALDGSGKVLSSMKLPDAVAGDATALCFFDGKLYIACFHKGEVYQWHSGSCTLLARGFEAPCSLIAYEGNRLLVANAGGDSIAQIIL